MRTYVQWKFVITYTFEIELNGIELRERERETQTRSKLNETMQSARANED